MGGATSRCVVDCVVAEISMVEDLPCTYGAVDHETTEPLFAKCSFGPEVPSRPNCPSNLIDTKLPSPLSAVSVPRGVRL